MRKRTILILISFIAEAKAQIPDLPLVGMYEQLQQHKVKSITFWSCKDSLLNGKEKSRFMNFDSHYRIEQEVNVEDGKEVPYEIYKYPSKNLVIKKSNPEDQTWFTYKYQLNEKGKVLLENISGTTCYKVEERYLYSGDTLLLSKEILDSSCEPYLDGEGIYKYEYSVKGKLIKSVNDKMPETILYQYDSEGNLFRKVKFGSDSLWEKHTTEYFYSLGKLIREVSEGFNSGNKEDVWRDETLYTFYENGLLKSRFIHEFKANRKFYELITYEFY